MVAIQAVNLVDLVPQGQQRADDRARAGAEDQVEALVKGALQHSLDFLEDAEAVLVPESEKAGIDLRRFIVVLADLPAPGRHGVDELRSLKEQEGTIREELKKLGEVD